MTGKFGEFPLWVIIRKSRENLGIGMSRLRPHCPRKQTSRLGKLVTPGGFEPPTLSLEGARTLNNINTIPTSSFFVHSLKSLFDFSLSEWLGGAIMP